VRREADSGRTGGKGGGPLDDQEISDLQSRVRALEQRLEAAGRAFEGK